MLKTLLIGTLATVGLLIGLTAPPAFSADESIPVILQTAATATGQGTPIEVVGFSTVGMQLTFTGTATVTFQAKLTPASVWSSVTCQAAADLTNTPIITASSSGLYQCNVAGFVSFSANITSYTSGAVTVLARATQSVFTQGGGGGAVTVSLPAVTVNPTGMAVPASAPWVLAALGCYNLTTIDLCQPNVAHDAAAATQNPLLMGGYASAAAPSDVSADVDAVRAWFLRNGSFVVNPVFNGNLAVADNGTSGPATQRVTIASDSTGVIQIIPGTTNGTTPCPLASAASTNATNCKASATLLDGYELVNTTGTIYFLRLYNLATAPTCSSATGFVRSIPIPASTLGAGIVRDMPVGETYSTGLAFCITGGGSSTDNTNAATGVYVSLNYK